MGNPALPLKGFDVAIAVLTMVNRVLPLDITWICQTQPTATMVPGLATSGLHINLHISPAQVYPWTLTPVCTASMGASCWLCVLGVSLLLALPTRCPSVVAGHLCDGSEPHPEMLLCWTPGIACVSPVFAFFEQGK